MLQNITLCGSVENHNVDCVTAIIHFNTSDFHTSQMLASAHFFHKRLMSMQWWCDVRWLQLPPPPHTHPKKPAKSYSSRTLQAIPDCVSLHCQIANMEQMCLQLNCLKCTKRNKTESRAVTCGGCIKIKNDNGVINMPYERVCLLNLENECWQVG